MDIYKRTCEKEGVIINKSEEKVEADVVLDSDDEEVIEEEEEEAEEPVDMNAVRLELECMKSRIQQLQLKLKVLQTPECPEEECVDFEIDLTCSENKDICALQKNQHKLQCQMNEVLRCCRLAKDQIADLRLRMCEKSRQVLELQKMFGLLNSWKNSLQHEFGICIERFEYLKTVKCSVKSVDDFLHANEVMHMGREKNFVLKSVYLEEKKKNATILSDMMTKFQDVFDLHVARFVYLEKLIHSRIACLPQMFEG